MASIKRLDDSKRFNIGASYEEIMSVNKFAVPLRALPASHWNKDAASSLFFRAEFVKLR